MSLSNPRASNNNPAKHFITWVGDARGSGSLSYYDKDLVWMDGDQERVGKKVFITDFDKFQFIVLDESMFSISGFNKPKNCGIWSNEIPTLDVGSRDLTVKLFDDAKTLVVTGKYKDIKDQVKGVGGKFTRSVYAWTDYFGEEGGTTIMIKMVGSSLGPWMDFIKQTENSSNNIESRYVKIIGVERHDSGIPFVSPVFGLGDKFDQDQVLLAVAADKKLQAYLAAYLGNDTNSVDLGPDDIIDDDDIAPLPTESTYQEDEVFDTSKWGSYTIPGTDINLGEKDLDELKVMKKELEMTQDFGETYANICEGVRYFQSGGDEVPPQAAPDAPENIEIDRPNPFAKPATVAAPAEDWREFTIEETGMKMGDMSLQDIEDGLAFINSKDGAGFVKYKEKFEAAKLELDPPKPNNPFAK